MTLKLNLWDFFRDYLSSVPVNLVRFISTVYRQVLYTSKRVNNPMPAQIYCQLMSRDFSVRSENRQSGGLCALR